MTKLCESCIETMSNIDNLVNVKKLIEKIKNPY